MGWRSGGGGVGSMILYCVCRDGWFMALVGSNETGATTGLRSLDRLWCDLDMCFEEEEEEGRRGSEPPAEPACVCSLLCRSSSSSAPV